MNISWLFHVTLKTNYIKMKRILIIYSLLMLPMFFNAQEQKKETEKIKWLSIAQAAELNKTNPKKVFMDVYTDWCVWCKVMDSKTFIHPLIISYVNENFYAVKFNAEGNDTVLINGRKFINPNPGVPRSTHQYAYALLKGKMGYPTVVFLNEKMELINSIPGYQKPAQLEKILKYFATDSYKTKDWPTYQQSYKGEIKEETVPEK